MNRHRLALVCLTLLTGYLIGCAEEKATPPTALSQPPKGGPGFTPSGPERMRPPQK